MEHQGPRTAGNKSLLTFRADVGIPGCTIYTPGSCSVPIPTKGGTQHTGRLPPEAALQAAAADEAGQREATSEYRSTYRADPSAYQPCRTTGGGYWFEERQRAAAVNSPPFLGESTYNRELEQGCTTAAQQLERSRGVSSTLVAYQVARAHRLQPELTRTVSEAPLGYRTTYSSNTALIAEAAAAARAAMVQRPVSCFGTERLRLAVMPSANKPAFDGSTSYGRDFGTAGSDPMLRVTASGCMAATTSDLNQGTTRTSNGHLPGYTGFIPAAAVIELATCKPDIKAAMLPATLDQYNRGRLAHYTGFKPHHAAAGATAVQPAHGPTAATTQGFVNLQVARCGPQPHDSSNCINSRKGIMGFFTGGGDSISDNGEADAQKFFVRLRPLEGRMKTFTASATNPAGCKFTS